MAFALSASTVHPWYWLPVLWMIPLLELQSLLFLSVLSSATYLGYADPVASDLAMGIGWGGAALLFAREAYARRRAATASMMDAAVAERASSHSASG